MSKNKMKEYLEIEDIEESKEKESEMILEKEDEIFADPTLDVTFKMLFGQDKNKDILISLLNGLLNFSGEKEIIHVEINANELVVSNVSSKKGETGITSAVDILCTNEGKQQIAIEMQGQKTNYFLTREQEYMAKLMSGQVKEGQGKQYHEKVLDTYIIVIGKENMFVGKTKLLNMELFEIDVEPMIVQTGEKYPGNKMHWKFYELPKFKASKEFKWINKDSIIKYQWLEFLIECNNQKAEPDRNELIKKGYEIMKTAAWDSDTKTLYWKQKQAEIDFIKQKEYDEEDKKELLLEAKNQGLLEGKLKGKLEGEIKQFKMLKKMTRKETETEAKKCYGKMTHKEQIEKYFIDHKSELENSDNESMIAGDIMDIEPDHA